MTRRARRWTALFVFVALVFASRAAASYALGAILQSVFARGTGCVVTIESSTFSFFPIEGELRGVKIRHASEPEDGGFDADRIAVRFHFLKVLRKELRLSDLVLDGARVSSQGVETGFRNTLAFLFPRDNGAPKPPPSRFAKIFGGWDFHVTEITIKSRQERLRSFVFGEERVDAVADDVKLLFVEQDSDSKKPYDVWLAAEGLTVDLPDGAHIPLGRVDGSGTIGLGKLIIKTASAKNAAQPTNAGESSFLSLGGEIGLRGVGSYGLRFDTTLASNVLNSVLGSTANKIPGDIKARGELTGSFSHPRFAAETEFVFLPDVKIPIRPECRIKRVAGQLTLADGELSAERLTLDDVGRAGMFKLTLKPPFHFELQVDTVLDRSGAFVTSCLGGSAASEAMSSEAGAEVSRALVSFHEALADSSSKIAARGTFEPLSVKASIDSEMHTTDLRAHSALKADVDLQSGLLQVKVAERGVNPQISTAPEDAVVADPEVGSPSGTKFALAPGTEVDLAASYSLASHQLEISKLRVSKYPTPRMLARLAPFISRTTYDSLRDLVRRESLIDLEGTAKRSPVASGPAEISGAGMLKLSELAVGSMSGVTLNLPFTLKGDLLSWKAASLAAEAGQIVSDGGYDFSSGISARAKVDGLSLERVPEWSSAFPNLRGDVSGAISFTGLPTRLSYEGAFVAKVYHRLVASSQRSSNLNVKGDLSALAVSGELFDRTASLSLRVPLSGAKERRVELKLLTNAMPLDFLLPTTKRSSEDTLNAAKPEALLTSSLNYTGPLAAPLLGEGSIVVDKFSVTRTDLRIRHESPLRITIQNGRLTFDDVTIFAQDRALTVQGTVDHRSGWASTVRGRWGLSALLPAFEGVESIAGGLEVNLSVSGPWNAPRVEGPISISRASLTVPIGDTIVGITDGVVEALFRGDELAITSISGQLGSGTISGEGRIASIFSEEDRALNIALRFSEAAFEPIENLSLSCSGGLTFVQHGLEPGRVEGEIEIQNALYEDTISLARVLRAITTTITSMTTPRSGAARASRDSNSNNSADIALALRVHANNDIVVETNFAQAELRGDIHVSGTAKAPILQGKIEALDGVFGLQANVFEIINAEAIFTERGDSLNPRLSILGESSVSTPEGDEHQVRINISGTLTNPDIKFSSDSGLPQEKIITLFGLGATLDQVVTRRDRRQRSIVELLNPTTEVALRDRLSGLTGFSEVQVDTALSPGTGEFVPRVIARRPLVGEFDLLISSELSGNQVSTFNVDYALSTYLSFITGWRTSSVTQNVGNSSGTYNLGLRYRRTFPGVGFLPRSLSRGQPLRGAEMPQ